MNRLIITAISLLFILPCQTSAQEKKADEFWGQKDSYLTTQANVMFSMVDSVLTANPPSTGNNIVRKQALYMLDMLLHDTRNDNSQQLNSFVSSRSEEVISDLAIPVQQGAKLYKIYNDGFIARTKTATIAFDLVRGNCNGKTLIPDNLIKKMVDKCDVLFITHNHGDHGDRAVVDMFINSGKPVYAPTEFWPENDKIIHLYPKTVIERAIKTANGTIDVRIFPGHQDELMNNLYVVTTEEGKTFAHVGDQYHPTDINWIMKIKDMIPPVDVLTVNCWANRMYDLIEGFAPKLVVTGHENEMGHTIDHREAFWLTFKKMKGTDRKHSIMGWGEMIPIN